MHPLTVEEYKFLRREILLRILLQNVTLLLLIPTLTAAIITSIAFSTHGAEIALGYASVAGMGGLYWIHSAARTDQIKLFLQRAETEPAAGIKWETWLASNRFSGILGSRWFISTKGVFVGSQAAAIILCGFVINESPGNPLALSVAAVIAVLTAVLMIQPKLMA